MVAGNQRRKAFKSFCGTAVGAGFGSLWSLIALCLFVILSGGRVAGATSPSRLSCRSPHAQGRATAPLEIILPQAPSNWNESQYWSFRHWSKTKQSWRLPPETQQALRDEGIAPPFRWSDVQKHLEGLYLGALGKVFSLRRDASTGKIQAHRNDAVAQRLRQEALAIFQQPIPPLSREDIDFAFRYVKFRRLAELGVYEVEISNQLWTDQPNEFANAIRNRFILKYWDSSNFAYRLSELVPNSTLSSAQLVDDVTVYGKNSNRIRSRMYFKEEEFQADAMVISLLLAQYRQALANGDASAAHAIASSANRYGSYFYPFAGMSLAENLERPKEPVELKRYFKNDHHDPLNLADPSQQASPEYVYRQNLIYQSVLELPAGTELEIHAHTVIHRKAYLKLGFHLAETRKGANFSATEIYILRATREEVLAKMRPE